MCWAGDEREEGEEGERRKAQAGSGSPSGTADPVAWQAPAPDRHALCPWAVWGIPVDVCDAMMLTASNCCCCCYCLPALCVRSRTHQNAGNALVMRATRVGADTVLSQIVRLVERAQLSKAPIQAYADYVASIFVPVVVLLALTTWMVW